MFLIPVMLVAFIVLRIKEIMEYYRLFKFY